MIPMDTILVVNAGSSSVKFQVFAIGGDSKELRRLLKGQVDGIGTQPRLRAESPGEGRLVDQTYAPDRVNSVRSTFGTGMSRAPRSPSTRRTQ